MIGPGNVVQSIVLDENNNLLAQREKTALWANQTISSEDLTKIVNDEEVDTTTARYLDAAGVQEL